MERTRSAAVLTIGALALATLLAPPAAAGEHDEELVPFGRCDVYRPVDGAVADGVDRCVTGMAPAGATAELPEPACPDAVSIPAEGGVEFYVGDCEPAHAETVGAAATAEPAPAPVPAPPPTTVPTRPAPAAAPRTTVAPTSTTVPAATATTVEVPPPPAPSGGASTARPATAEVVTDPASSVRLTSIGRPAEVDDDHAPIVMLFALALVSLVLLGISRTRAERR